MTPITLLCFIDWLGLKWRQAVFVVYLHLKSPLHLAPFKSMMLEKWTTSCWRFKHRGSFREEKHRTIWTPLKCGIFSFKSLYFMTRELYFDLVRLLDFVHPRWLFSHGEQLGVRPYFLINLINGFLLLAIYFFLCLDE